MKEYNVTVEKRIKITVLNEGELLKMYQDSVDPDGDIEVAVEYLAQCILGDMRFAGVGQIERDNGIFNWSYGYLTDEAYIN